MATTMGTFPTGSRHKGTAWEAQNGYDVLHPMAWDAFGLPAENAAIERGVNPASWTRKNIGKMKEQLQAMGGSFDWSREFATCEPKFYKHTQHIFLLLYKRGLAYQAESLVNYDPIDRTVLANEQVDANGFSWRSGAKVQLINLKQWFLRITKFENSLLDDMDTLSQNKRWPERVLSMQRNWLGRSVGANIKFQIFRHGQDFGDESVEVFTTRPDTLYGVQYLAISVNHPVTQKLAKENTSLATFIESTSSLPPGSKAGYLLPHLYARNPLSFLRGSPPFTHDDIPVYVAPYVLDGYGQGAVMGVPGHDKRDYSFWKQNCDEVIRTVIEPPDIKYGILDNDPEIENKSEPFEEPGILSSSCGDLAGLSSVNVSKKIIEDLRKVGHLASNAESWRLRDWLISRQRFWGTPIPIIHCNACGTVPVPIEELPVLLPDLEDSSFEDKVGNPLETASDWVNTVCPSCRRDAKRETDTMDTFMDSSWYFMRFGDFENVGRPFSPEAAEACLPVDIYIGGVEHAILHLLYARFISKFLASEQFWPSGGGKENKAEPFHRVISQGMVHGKTYIEPETGRFLRPEEVDLGDPLRPRIINSGLTPKIRWEKMSKSKYNGVDPTNCIEKYGADATRAHILFQAPVSEVLEWDEERVVGIQRWFGRIWRLTEHSQSCSDPTMTKEPFVPPSTPHEAHVWRTVQRTIISVTASLSQTFTLNTVVSNLMGLTNTITRHPVSPTTTHHTLSALIRMLAPIAPAFAEECWETLQSASPSPTSIFDAPFPTPDGSIATPYSRRQICVVQENGRRRLAVDIPVPNDNLLGQGGDDPLVAGSKKAKLREWAVAQIARTEDGKAWLSAARERRGGRDWTSVVVVGGGKVVNFVG